VPDSVEPAGLISPDDVLTAGEVAGMLRMTRAWVYSETRQNRIPHMRFGRRFRYRRSTIMAWLGAQESGRYLPSRPAYPSSESTSGAADQRVAQGGRRPAKSAQQTPTQPGLF
jgi:excisionase family DNA binding protein